MNFWIGLAVALCLIAVLQLNFDHPLVMRIVLPVAIAIVAIGVKYLIIEGWRDQTLL